MPHPLAPKYEFGDFRIDATKRLLARRDGTPVPLTPRVFDTLLFLVEHHGTVLNKERLMEAVWPDAIVEENNLSQNISTLRRVFGETPGSHHFIVTVPGRGYRFVADVRSCENGARPEGSEEASTTDKPPGEIESASVVHPVRAGPSHLRAVMVASLTFLLLGLVAFFFIRSRAHHELESPARIALPAVSIPEKSIAVLPLENLSDDKENTFFADGLHDDILTSVAKISDLKVISRRSVMAYQKPDGRDMREIGRALGVASVLEGSVRRTGNHVLVNVQLIDARNDRHLWAERYDRTVADSIGLQGELATQIAAALKATLAPEEKARLDAEPTANSEAYVLYLTALGKERTDEIAAERLRAGHRG
jgi:TolB-like protein/DNA-binding winged helix-turn-helix (wHTH) protein